MEAANKGACKGPSASIGLNIVLPNEEIMNDYQDISLRFRHFFTRKVMFVKNASAYVVMPGGYGTLDELAEILALVQTAKTRAIPIILVNREFWKDLLFWFENHLIKTNMLEEADTKLYTVVETPEEVVQVMKEFYKDRSFDPSEDERRLLEEL